MDQFRQVGETLGSLNALMVLKQEIQINQKQCCLLFDMLTLAFETISEEIRQNLLLEERSTKWKALELPMRDLHRVFKEAELYIRNCMDIKDWWGKAISHHMNRDCVELHIHNLLCCFPVVIEAMETAAEISGADQDDMQRRRIALVQKYDQECDDPKFFMWKFGKQYLVPREICSRLDAAWREDRWLLLEKIGEKKMTTSKHEQRLVELLFQKLNHGEASEGKLLPSSILVGAPDYYVKRRLGSGYPLGGGHLKEIRWLGESFAVRTFYRDIDPLQSDISFILGLSHPNVLQYLCALYDDERKEGFLVMELMSKDLGSYIKENSGQRNRIPFTIPTAVDIMLQIARGLEYLHSKRVYHGDLNPSNILLKARNASVGGFQAKVTGFGMTSIKSYSARSPKPTGMDLEIWLAPEVLAELEQPGFKCTTRYTNKADVYSFGMLCFELLSGKVPFEDGHLQGEKMVRNIRAGGRPLFSYPTPKYLTNLIRKCWQTTPNLRPSFSSICRILRYIKKILVINPDHGDPDSPPPLVDYCDMEARYLKKFPGSTSEDLAPVSQIPFQMVTYKIVEKEKIYGKKWEVATDQGSLLLPASVFDDEHLVAMDDLFFAPSDRRSVCSEIIDGTYSTITVDQRSVKSEIPHQKRFTFEPSSFGSESPAKIYLNSERKKVFVMDQRSPKIQALERKTEQNSTGQKLVKVPDKANTASKVAEYESASPRRQENIKSAPIKLTKQKSKNAVILEKKMPLRRIVDHKPPAAEHSEETKSFPATGYQELTEVPEMKILSKTDCIQKKLSVSLRTSDKMPEPTAQSNQKLSKFENSEKIPIGETKSKKIPETRKNDSPRSSLTRKKKAKPILSPASSPSRPFKMCTETPKSDSRSSSGRIRNTNLSSTPASSPSRVFKMCGYSEAPKNESPRSSPARMKKTMHHSSPASSPSIISKTCASPRYSSTCHSKEHTSPMSAMSPCARCSRLGRQSSLPATNELTRPKIGHESS